MTGVPHRRNSLPEIWVAPELEVPLDDLISKSVDAMETGKSVKWPRLYDYVPQKLGTVSWQEVVPAPDATMTFISSWRLSLSLSLIAICHIAAQAAEHFPYWAVWVTLLTILRTLAEADLWISLRVRTSDYMVTTLDVPRKNIWLPGSMELLARALWGRELSTYVSSLWTLGLRIGLSAWALFFVVTVLEDLRKKDHEQIGRVSSLILCGCLRAMIAAEMPRFEVLLWRAALESKGLVFMFMVSFLT